MENTIQKTDAIEVSKEAGKKMLHTVYTSKNLGFAKICSCNRDIRKKQVDQIFRGLDSEQTWHLLQDIFVDIETGEIVDGNHRFKALQMYAEKHGGLNGHVVYYQYYHRNEGQSLASAVKQFNDGRAALMTKDYSRLSELDGNTAITRINEFGRTHSLLYTVNKKGHKVVKDRYNYAVIFGKNVTKEMKNGTITVTEHQLEGAAQLYREIEAMVNACDMPTNSWFEHFCAAWHHVRTSDPLFALAFDKIGFQRYVDELERQSVNWGFQSIGKNVWIQRFQTVASVLGDRKIA